MGDLDSDLIAWSETDLLKTKIFGRKSIKELREVLAPYHVELRR